MDEVQNAALADHCVIIEILLQTLPQFKRHFIERLIAVQQIVRADDRGIAPYVTPADPPFLKDRDLFLAKFFGQIIGRCKAVPATADDNNIIGTLWLWVPPCWRPTLVPCQGFLDHFEPGIAHIHLIFLPFDTVVCFERDIGRSVTQTMKCDTLA